MRSHKQYDVQLDVLCNETKISFFLCRKHTYACYLPMKYADESSRNISIHLRQSYRPGMAEEELQDKRKLSQI